MSGSTLPPTYNTTAFNPQWFEKSGNQLDTTNMELVGSWLEGQTYDGAGNANGFQNPGDVAADPRNDDIFYVASYTDNCIWKVDATQTPPQVRVFAGAVDHSAGYVDAAGQSARFNGPCSLVWVPGDVGHPEQDVLYVAEQDNDVIRYIKYFVK